MGSRGWGAVASGLPAAGLWVCPLRPRRAGLEARFGLDSSTPVTEICGVVVPADRHGVLSLPLPQGANQDGAPKQPSQDLGTRGLCRVGSCSEHARTTAWAPGTEAAAAPTKVGPRMEGIEAHGAAPPPRPPSLAPPQSHLLSLPSGPFAGMSPASQLLSNQPCGSP